MPADRNRRDTRIDLASATSPLKHKLHDNREPPSQQTSATLPATKKLKKRSGATSSLPEQQHAPIFHVQSPPPLTLEAKSPWTAYTSLYTLQFGDGEYFTIAEKKRPDPDKCPVVIVKCFSGPSAESRIQAIRRIHSTAFVTMRQVFSTANKSYALFDFMPLSLAEIAGHPLVDDLRLASILGQVSYQFS